MPFTAAATNYLNKLATFFYQGNLAAVKWLRVAKLTGLFFKRTVQI